MERDTAMRIGVVAATAPAMSPAVGETRRRPVDATTTTVARAASAFGKTTVHVESPNAATKSAGTQNDHGILSRVTVPAGSKAPKKKFAGL